MLHRPYVFEKGVQLVSLKESIDTSTPTAAMAQFERDVIAERT